MIRDSVDLISIVVPCYNEASAIECFADHLSTAISKFEIDYQIRFEVIFVDDGSRDGTSDLLRARDLKFPSKVIVFSRNFGKEAALTAGLDAASGDAVILMDSDLQHPPERIGELIEQWRSGYDVVYFFKRTRNRERAGKGTGSKFFYWLVNYGARFEIPANAGDFRLLDRKVVNAIGQLPERERFMKGLYGWVGFKQKGLPLDIPERHGQPGSRFTPTRLLVLALDGLTSFSIAPVRLISLFGFVVLGLSALYTAWLIAERLLFGSPFSGFTSIVVLITFFGGVQLVCLGIIGEYVGKSLLEAKNRPSYLVREIIQLSQGKLLNGEVTKTEVHSQPMYLEAEE